MAIDKKTKVKLYDPHPGLMGATMRLYQPVVDVLKELNGKTMTLEDTVKTIEKVTKKYGGKVEVVDGLNFISYRIGQEGSIGHLFRLLKYEGLK